MSSLTAAAYYAGAAVAALLGVALILWGGFWADRGGRKLPRCRKCWYDLSAQLTAADASGDVPTCPECGKAVKSRRRLHRGRRRPSQVVLGLLLIAGAAALAATPRVSNHLGWRHLGESYALIIGLPFVPDPHRNQLLKDLCTTPDRRWPGQGWLLPRRLAAAIGSDMNNQRSARQGGIELYLEAKPHLSVEAQQIVERGIVRAASDTLYAIRVDALQVLRDSVFFRGKHPELSAPVRRAIDDRDPRSAALAAQLLSRTTIGDAEAVELLRKCLDHADADVRRTAVLALRNHLAEAHRVAEELAALGDPEAIRTLHLTGTPAGRVAPDLIRSLAHADEFEWDEIARAAVAIDPEAQHGVEAAEALLASPDVEIRLRGAGLAEAWGPAAAPLLERLREMCARATDARERQAACWAVSQIEAGG